MSFRAPADPTNASLLVQSAPNQYASQEADEEKGHRQEVNVSQA
jgi:hypothetical protein